GFKGDINKPGLTPSIPSWADDVVKGKAVGIVLETAHPTKFGETVQNAVGRIPSMPESLERVLRLKDNSIPMSKDYESFKDWLVENL
ncbi:MAG: threonine synthase, partial [Treponema sp.]|nr:threonine synthase [Treponema sp.]